MEDRRRNIRKDLSSKISSVVSGLRLNESLKNHTTFHIGGPCDYFAEVQSKPEIQKLYSIAGKAGIPVMVLGGGSNILVSDKGFRGIAIKLAGPLASFNIAGNIIECGCGAGTQAVLKASMESELSGLECLAGIPGTIGGAIVGNAGSKDAWIGGVVESVEVIDADGKILEIPKENINFTYRGSDLEKYVLTGARLNLKKSLKNDIFNKVEASLNERSKNQPMGSWNAGCIFKNPAGDNAGRLIDKCGLKGLKFGGAKVSEKHANFILNVDNATAADVLELIKIIRKKVSETFKINLELEIKIIGEK